jgi:hypothetical protein
MSICRHVSGAIGGGGLQEDIHLWDTWPPTYMYMYASRCAPLCRCCGTVQVLWPVHFCVQPARLWLTVFCTFTVSHLANNKTCWRPSVQVLWDMKARPNSPGWLVEETATIRKGLLTLRQNLVLLRDPENPEALYPRCANVLTPTLFV